MNWPKVGIIVQYWSTKSKPFLDACIQSIRNLDYPNYQIVLVCPKWNAPREYKDIIVSPELDNYAGPYGHQFGVDHADRDCEHYLTLNDDTILTRDSLKHMVEQVKHVPRLINPYSNDGGSPAHFPFRAYREEMLVHLPTMMTMESPLLNYHEETFEVPLLCMFATLVPKVIWDAIGGFDVNFPLGGGDDVDFCMRAKEKGYKCYLALNALIFHSIGCTTTTGVSPKQRIENIVYFKNKWGVFPPGMSEETIKMLSAQIPNQRSC